MPSFDETTATEIVLERMLACADPRMRQVMASIVTHLHAVVREVEPTFAEWLAAIRFLTATGQISDEARQEFILLSDVLGVTMLVDAISNRKPSGATPSTVLGPFHVEGAPELPMGADLSRTEGREPCFVSGGVLSAGDGKPVADAVLDVWQTSEDGFYDIQQPGVQPAMNLRGRFRTGADGRYWFRTVRPSSYPIPTDGPVGQLLERLGRHPYRPAHIHMIVAAPGFEPVTTHVFAAGDPYLGSDAVFGVKDALIAEFVRSDDPEAMAERGVDRPFSTVAFDIGLQPAADARPAAAA